MNAVSGGIPFFGLLRLFLLPFLPPLSAAATTKYTVEDSSLENNDSAISLIDSCSAGQFTANNMALVCIYGGSLPGAHRAVHKIEQ